MRGVVQRVVEIEQPDRRVAGNIHVISINKGKQHATQDYSDVPAVCSFSPSASTWAADNGAAPDRGALFKVTEGHACMYLFGTMHVGAGFLSAGAAHSRRAGRRCWRWKIDPLGDQQQ
jgi:hypothetical protein